MFSYELVNASDHGDIDTVKSLIRNGANVNSQVGEWKIAPIHAAASKGHMGILEILIANGANINIVNEFGCTPLYFAAALGYTEIVKLLLKNGANINLKEVQKGETPLDAAKRNGHSEIVNILQQSSSSTKCYIATQVYGNSFHPSVIVLRKYRDNVISKYFFGRLFINMYYSISPYLIGIIDKHKKLENSIRKMLDYLVSKIPINF